MVIQSPRRWECNGAVIDLWPVPFVPCTDSIIIIKASQTVKIGAVFVKNISFPEIACVMQGTQRA